MEEEYLYLDLESKEGKVILAFAEQYLKENWESKNDFRTINYIDYEDEKDVDILEIWKYKGEFVMELNIFRKGKYYTVSKKIDSDWITPRLRETRLNDLGI
jgi:hypothetical protein